MASIKLSESNKKTFPTTGDFVKIGNEIYIFATVSGGYSLICLNGGRCWSDSKTLRKIEGELEIEDFEIILQPFEVTP